MQGSRRQLKSGPCRPHGTQDSPRPQTQSSPRHLHLRPSVVPVALLFALDQHSDRSRPPRPLRPPESPLTVQNLRAPASPASTSLPPRSPLSSDFRTPLPQQSSSRPGTALSVPDESCATAGCCARPSCLTLSAPQINRSASGHLSYLLAAAKPKTNCARGKTADDDRKQRRDRGHAGRFFGIPKIFVSSSVRPARALRHAVGTAARLLRNVFHPRQR
mmetsp:Transcript_28894/g.73075  ORF Transcript_28894/g.73075 Transcript_28894/m.73075 type:complete len:218 (+) Transcript_28894:2364-3017(+)